MEGCRPAPERMIDMYGGTARTCCSASPCSCSASGALTHGDWARSRADHRRRAGPHGNGHARRVAPRCLGGRSRRPTGAVHGGCARLRGPGRPEWRASSPPTTRRPRSCSSARWPCPARARWRWERAPCSRVRAAAPPRWGPACRAGVPRRGEGDLRADGRCALGPSMSLLPRTVSTHLYRIFPKLGVTSRPTERDHRIGADVGPPRRRRSPARRRRARRPRSRPPR